MFWLKKNLPKLVLVPSLGILSWFVYGFIFWTIYISFTKSKMLPRYEIWGIDQYIRLWNMPRWHVAVENLLIFTVLFIILCIAIGILLSILLDQKIRAEGFLRTIYLYPMALSFIVTGTAWKWVLNPTLGIEKFVNDMGFETFKFDWLVTPEMSIYTIVIAGVWQSSGFIMAIFLAGLRSVDDEIIKAANNLKTYSEATNSFSEQILKIRDTIKSANTLVFLGLAFHQQNLDLLYGESPIVESNNKTVIASTYKISKFDSESLMENLKKRGGYQSIEASNDTAFQTIKNYSTLFK